MGSFFRHRITLLCALTLGVLCSRYFALSQDNSENGYEDPEQGYEDEDYGDDSDPDYENTEEEVDYSAAATDDEEEEENNVNVVASEETEEYEDEFDRLSRAFGVENDEEELWEDLKGDYSYEFSMINLEDPFVPQIYLTQIYQEKMRFDDVMAFEEKKKEGDLLVPVSSMTLSGVWSSGGVKKALIIAGRGKGRAQIVGIGDALGDKNGTIIDILPDAVVVREESLNSDQKRIVEDVKLEFKEL